MEVGTDVTSL